MEEVMMPEVDPEETKETADNPALKVEKEATEKPASETSPAFEEKKKPAMSPALLMIIIIIILAGIGYFILR